MSLKRICDVLVQRNVQFRGVVARRFLATESMDPEIDVAAAADEKPIYPDDPQAQEELDRKRNKSRLNSSHRNMLMGVRPYDQPIEWFHHTVRYKQRMLGRYGLKANNEPVGFAWPTPKEIKDTRDYERIAFPLSLKERWQKLEEAKRLKAEKIQAREAEIAEKLAKMDQWTAELNTKIAKKEAELEAARLRKERMVTEIRKHFGFKISPDDEKFKAMLAQKEKEEKKKKKEAKKQAQLEKLTNMIQKMTNEPASQEQATTSTKSVE
ncbi:growth arrest and DNA damage-inducible proteins-interacting protein 1 [Monomorium pharaonis]|uniref:growth arrest and DNA damage-inducible proteins-interacting protein 1 n=1 Tax=Monomorium pharaonis TaxID=307658 RepID=UPI00063EF757|nr:growth arrest and DNA damage-inducible proteins-interacting protein 1 [Monomorium pharaonis]XP_012524970.1 growth arrest and DNA damage-inducible proteins-interacting protein 1 [Monomorium pharaonis]XP_012524972.1 growth arrest and DNA damage-inducible proteins-interacting protein 1 [Monomorium pharaonis]XP_028049537.1 growth arrest and DNA damage-inducible proteins-interacting protein 1 [Monomorium pharaonis]